MRLVQIPAGEFLMGSTDEEVATTQKLARGDVMDDWIKAESPQRKVKIAKAFYMGVHTVTQADYTKVTGEHPSYFSARGSGKRRVMGLDTRRFPVEGVSYDDALKFCVRLGQRAEEKGYTYRLPTEAEWEYACRAGTRTAFHFGGGISGDRANFDGQFPFPSGKPGTILRRTCEVGSYRGNAFGLHDMHGNVFQWCSDWYALDAYAKDRSTDPIGPKEGAGHVLRGGGWGRSGVNCRSASRFCGCPDDPPKDIGFRVVCEMAPR